MNQGPVTDYLIGHISNKLDTPPWSVIEVLDEKNPNFVLRDLVKSVCKRQEPKPKHIPVEFNVEVNGNIARATQLEDGTIVNIDTGEIIL